MDGRRNLKFKISNLKFGLALSLAMLWASFCQAQTGPYVQPMQYRHYSFPSQVNIGAGQLKITNPSAFLELGDSLNSKKGLLLPRGYTDSISSPARGLIIYDLRGQKIKWYNGSSWDSSGSSAGPGGPFMELADTASMLLNYRHWLAGYQKVSNLSTNVLLGASNTLYPSQLAVKTYVDNQLAGIGSGTFVPNTRQLIAGPWINTLGDLSANRTIGIDTASLFNQTTGALRRKDSLTTTNLKGYVTRKILGDSMAVWRAGSGILGQPTITYGVLSTDLNFPRTGLATLDLAFIGGQPTSSSNIPFYNGANLAWNSGLAIRASNVVTSGTDTLANKAYVRSLVGSGGGSSTLNSTYIGFGNGSNALTGSADLTYTSNVVYNVAPAAGAAGYALLYSGIGRLSMSYDQAANLSQIQAANSPFRIDFGQSTTSDPGSPTDGMMWYNSTSDLFKIRANGVTEALNAPVYVDEDYFDGDFTSGTPLTLIDLPASKITSGVFNYQRIASGGTGDGTKVATDDGTFKAGAVVTLTSPVNGQPLVYQDGAFVNGEIPATGSGILGADSMRLVVDEVADTAKIIGYYNGRAYTFLQNGGGSTSTLPLPHNSFFTAANGTALTDYTPDDGADWTGASWEIQSNKLQSTLTTSTHAVTPTGVTNYYTEVKATFTNMGNTLDVMTRYKNAGADMVMVRLAMDYIEVFNRVAGTYTSFATSFPTLTAGVEYTLAINLSGNFIDVTLDGVSQVSTTIPTTQTGTDLGVKVSGLTLGSDIKINSITAHN